MSEPLDYLPRSELQYNFMKNLENRVMGFNKNNHFRFWWENTVNWAKVQEFINSGTCKGGSTSSAGQCQFIGIDPNEYYIQEKYKKDL